MISSCLEVQKALTGAGRYVNEGVALHVGRECKIRSSHGGMSKKGIKAQIDTLYWPFAEAIVGYAGQ